MPSPTGPHARMFTSLSVDAAWTDVIWPWMSEAKEQVLSRPGVHLIVTPTRAMAALLRGRALDSRASLLGIRFIVPGQLREFISRHVRIAGRPGRREDFRLLAAAAAEKVAAETEDDELRRAASAVVRAPEPFLRAFDQLESSGWDAREALPVRLRAIADEYVKLTISTGLLRTAELDRVLQARAPSCGVDRMLIVGFDGRHWNLWPLLHGAVLASNSATVLLPEPRDEAREVDSLWVGTWEQEFGPSEPMAGADRARPFPEILRLPEGSTAVAQRAAEPAAEVDFLVGDSVDELAQAIVAQVTSCLLDEQDGRIGLVFPQASALSRLVGLRLHEAEIPHHDGLRHPRPGPMEDAVWPIWLRLQEDRRVALLVRLVEACPTLLEDCGGLTGEVVIRRLRKELRDLLIDDLDVLATSMAEKMMQPVANTVAALIRGLVWLPEKGRIRDYLDLTSRAFLRLGWKDRATEVDHLGESWAARAEAEVSRRAWLRWLSDCLVSMSSEREASGRHPYARLHLLTYAEAEPLEWSHLILCGMNEGEWPPPTPEEGWLSERDIGELNGQVRVLNAGATRQGRYGEGHEAVRPGHTWCTTARDLKAIAARQFFNVIENTSQSITVAAALRAPDEPERPWPPGEYFTRLHFCARGSAVSRETMEALSGETQRWLADGKWAQKPAIDVAGVAATRRAWDLRRDDSKEFGEFEFALRGELPNPITLSATNWERALRTPALMFLEVFLGVKEPQDPDDDLTALAVGTWAHRWLAEISGVAGNGIFIPMPDAKQMERRVRGGAARSREDMEALMKLCGRDVPDWWFSTWGRAAAIAVALIRKMPVGSRWERCATEFRIETVNIALPGDVHVQMRGQVDLILVRVDTRTNARLPGTESWIIDYKTGEHQKLVARKLVDGDGLQLALYALAARANGTKSVGLSRLAPAVDLEEPQLTLADLDALPWLWRGLGRMQIRGLFGMHGPLRSDYGISSNYPLATLAIDPKLLDQKWARSHPDLVGGDIS